MRWLKNKMPRSMKQWMKAGLRRSRSLHRSLFKGTILLRHRFSGVRPKHLVISGCPRSGTTMLYNMVRSSATGPIYMPDREISALDTHNRRDERIVTKRPLDIFRLNNIDSELSPLREVYHLVVIRDPRDLVSSLHRSVPNQFFQGYDYQFFLSSDTKSFSFPGIAAVAEAIEKAELAGQRVFVIRYEDIVRSPERARRLLVFATGFPLTQSFGLFHTHDIPDDLSRALNGVRPVEVPDQPAWTKGGRYLRVCQQLRLFPEMEALTQLWGYTSTDEIRKKYDLSVPEITQKPGTIIAFHTDDDVYRAEAARFVRRLDELGLTYDITVVPPRGEWVENCAMKPEFILEARKRLRGPLLYLDVDAHVHSDPWPYLSLFEGDMAAYIHTTGVLNSATLLLADTPAAEQLLKTWVARQKEQPKEWDQKVLQQVVERDESSASPMHKIQRLPPNLNFLFDRQYPTFFGQPIIEQLQVSREVIEGKDAALERRRTRMAELSVVDEA